MIDAVLTSHPDALTCGTAKWSRLLAEKLGVPCEALTMWGCYRHPLVSIRMIELSEKFGRATSLFSRSYDLLLHDYRYWPEEIFLGASTIYAANPEIADLIRPYRPDVEVLWCPATVSGNSTRGTLDILTFGMAHKMGAAPFEKLKALLDQGPQDYTISLSTAIHDGQPWDDGFASAQGAMSALFGDRLRVLGFLADDGLARVARQSNAIALFFPAGVRQNNTSFWAALETGCPVITNLDALSPPELIHNVSVFDVHQMTAWPDAEQRKVMRAGAHKVLEVYSWDRLLKGLHAPVTA